MANFKLLYFAILDKNTEEIINLLQHSDVNLTDEFQRTGLHYAVLNNDLDTVKIFMKFKANLNTQDYLGQTPLHAAAENNFFEIANFLIQNKAVVEAKDNYGNTPLTKAVFNFKDDTQLIELLLRHGADKNLKNDSDVSPLDFAKKAGISVVFDLFLKE